MLITSLQNPRIKAIRALRMRKHRGRAGRYLVEGIRIVDEALTRQAPVEALVYAPELLVSERARDLVARHPNIEHVVVSREVFASLSDREDPQGIAAIMRAEPLGLDGIALRHDMFVLVAWQLSTPGNLGSIIRTADAAGASAVIVVEPSVDLYDPQTVRATMGSLYALPVAVVSDEHELPEWYASVRAAGIPLSVVGSSARGTRLIYDIDLRGPLALLIGSEQDGLNTLARETADVIARLPMAGSASSLNVSAATAAIVYEAVRQRITRTGPSMHQSSLESEDSAP